MQAEDFRVGQWYRNRRGRFQVLDSISDKLHVVYESGEKASLDRQVSARIITNLETEEIARIKEKLPQRLQSDWLGTWNGEDFSLFKYLSFQRGWSAAASGDILAFKRGDCETIEFFVGIMTTVIKGMESYLRETCKCRYLVAVPSSEARNVDGPGETLCSMVAENFKWLDHLPNALWRFKTIAKSSKATDHRPLIQDHMSSILYNGSVKDATEESFVMFDDVITTKATSEASRRLLKQSTDCHSVKGFFLGKTSYR